MQSHGRATRIATYDNVAAVEAFRVNAKMIEATHRPAIYPFFIRLAGLPSAAALAPDLLGRIHLTYRAAMHATRAMVPFLPHLDTPELRQRKLRICADGDGAPPGLARRSQFTEAFRNLGARLRLDDEKFGDLDRLSTVLDGRTAEFLSTVRRLYARSLGPWCVVERMSAGWRSALMEALAVHAPPIRHEPYFADDDGECAKAALELVSQVLAERPDLLDRTVADAWAMARALDLVWDALDDVVTRAALAAA